MISALVFAVVVMGGLFGTQSGQYLLAQTGVGARFLSRFVPGARSTIPDMQIIQITIADVTIDSANTELLTRKSMDETAGTGGSDSLWGMYANVYQGLYTFPYNFILRDVRFLANQNDSNFVAQLLWHVAGDNLGAFLFDSLGFADSRWDSLTRGVVSITNGSTAVFLAGTTLTVLNYEAIIRNTFAPKGSQLAVKFQLLDLKNSADTLSGLTSVDRTAILANSDADSVVIILSGQYW